MNIFSDKKLIPILVIVGGSTLLLISFGIRHSFGLYLIPISEYLNTGRELFSFASASGDMLIIQFSLSFSLILFISTKTILRK